ncbi:hypothetical protein MKEN_00506700 [Mycena kentingensis (nom. inval.)]|nr:hypothetical protein MKEN_00506700 [Mycena kentingensis (nom. inval.)]
MTALKKVRRTNWALIPTAMSATAFIQTALSVDPEVDRALVESTAALLQTSYSEPQRHYHTLEHIQFMLDAFTSTTPVRPIIELAIWFHDYVYDPAKGGPWNERESIRVWEQFVEDSKSEGMMRIKEPVSALIEATISHNLPKTLPSSLSRADAAHFLDLDMGILAADSFSYDKYAQGIRKEYSLYNDVDYCAGRTKVLHNFLSRDRIFLAENTEELERRARENIRNEIERLEARK